MKMLSRLRKHNNGSAIAWAVLSMLILTILVAGALAIGLAYARHSINDINEKQAYLTARSALNAIISKMDGYTAEGPIGAVEANYDNPLVLKYVGNTLTVDGFNFPESMGTASAIIERLDSDRIKILVTAQKSSQTENIAAIFKRSVQIIESTVEYTSASAVFKDGFFVTTAMFSDKGKMYITITGDLYITEMPKPSSPGQKYYFVGGDLYTDGSQTWGVHFYDDENHKIYPQDIPEDMDLNLYEVSWDGNYLPVTGAAGCDLTSSFNSADHNDYPFPWFRLQGGTYSKDIFVADDSTYYIKLSNDSTLDLDLQKTGGENKANVFVFIDDGSTLNLKAVDPDINLYALGAAGSSINIADGVTMTGALTGANITFEGDFYINHSQPSCEIPVSYTPPEGSGEGEDPSTEPEEPKEIHTWSFEYYDND